MFTLECITNCMIGFSTLIAFGRPTSNSLYLYFYLCNIRLVLDKYIYSVVFGTFT